MYGERIRELRKSNHISMDLLGSTIGKSKQYMSQVERNEIGLSFDVACKIADALNVSVDDLRTKTSQEPLS